MRKNQKGFTLTELLVVITIIGILAALLMTSLARGKAKAYRIACVSNIGNVYKAGLNFAQDNGERLPWQLTINGVKNHLLSTATGTYGKVAGTQVSNELISHTRSLHAGGCFGVGAMKIELTTAKILLSPCDASRKVFNIALEGKWKDDINTKDSWNNKNKVGDGASYCLVRGADAMRPTSIYSVTRNLDNDGTIAWENGKPGNVACGGSLKGNAAWVGNDDADAKTNANVMAGLSTSQGQLVTMDGGARQSQDSDLGDDGALTKPAIDAIGGLAKGTTSMAVIRGGGL